MGDVTWFYHLSWLSLLPRLFIPLLLIFFASKLDWQDTQSCTAPSRAQPPAITNELTLLNRGETN